ncbi:MAG: MBL fold metallo-hydrolase [Pseudomonadota bacterium]
MPSLTRRALLATASAGLSLPALPALGAAPMLGDARPTFRRFKVGAFEVTTLLDGAVPVEGPQPIFGQDQSVADVEALLAENNLSTTTMEFTFAPTLVNTGAELILFDTGNGAGARPARGQLAAAIEAAGYRADQVDIVVLTHMHPDHIGGVLENGAPAFPNARYVTGSAEYNFWTDEARVGTPGQRIYDMVQANVAPVAEMMSFLDPGGSVVSGIEAVGAFGHTPGHMAYHIESEGESLMLTADAANHFVLSLERPDWHVRFDADKEAAAATRKALFGMIASDRIPFVGYHMPFPSVGYLEAAGDGFRYTAASYQLNL